MFKTKTRKPCDFVVTTFCFKKKNGSFLKKRKEKKRTAQRNTKHKIREESPLFVSEKRNKRRIKTFISENYYLFQEKEETQRRRQVTRFCFTRKRRRPRTRNQGPGTTNN